MGFLLDKVINFPHILLDRSERRSSIRGAESIMVAPYQKDSYSRICPGKELFFLPHIIETIDFDTLLERKETQKNKICRDIDARDYFFSSSRHYWHGHRGLMTDNKGNDVMLKSFALYLSLSKDQETKLVLVDKGPDVRASKQIAKDLGIDRYIVWVGEKTRHEIEGYYQGATLCFGQFGTPVIAYTALEPLANGTPCISFFMEDTFGIPYYREFPPLINGKHPEMIANKICNLMSSKDYYDNLCYESWKWVKDNCSATKFVETFLKVFE